jgi:hypothetical protein
MEDMVKFSDRHVREDKEVGKRWFSCSRDGWAKKRKKRKLSYSSIQRMNIEYSG